MYAIYGNIYHQYTPNVSIYTIHGSYGIFDWSSLSTTVVLRGFTIKHGDFTMFYDQTQADLLGTMMKGVAPVW
jgi:hypothetical protein